MGGFLPVYFQVGTCNIGHSDIQLKARLAGNRLSPLECMAGQSCHSHGLTFWLLATHSRHSRSREDGQDRHLTADRRRPAYANSSSSSFASFRSAVSKPSVNEP